MRNQDELAVARHDAFVAEVVLDAVADCGDTAVAAAVVLVAGEGIDVEIVPAQERRDDLAGCGRNSVDCRPHIDYFGRANAVDTESSPESDVERGAE